MMYFLCYYYRTPFRVSNEHLGDEVANSIWQSANVNSMELERQYPDITGDSRMMILPSAALYLALREQVPERVDLLKEYGTEMGEKIAGIMIIFAVVSVPGSFDLCHSLRMTKSVLLCIFTF